MILYYFFRFVEFILMLLPYSWRKLVFVGLAKFAYTVDKKHREVVRINLEFAYNGTMEKEEIDTITRYCYRNLLLNFLQVMENRKIPPEKQAKIVSFENREFIDQAREQGRPIILISAHFGNWELGATTFATQIMPTVSIHKKLNNPWFNRYLMSSRTRLNMDMVEKHGAVRHLTRALKNGQVISLMIDQNINPRESIIVDFFGKRVTQTSAPAFLARKYDAVIIPVFIHTQDEKRYVVRFETPLEVEKTDDANADILRTTQAQSNVLERIVRAEPKFWFWCHRRWKTEYEEIYK